MRGRVDQTLLLLSLALIIGGFLIFTSASMGLLAKEGARFGAVAIKQFTFGIILGGAFLIFFSSLDPKKLRRWSLALYIFSFFLSLAVFLPGFGFEHGGSIRWLSFGNFSFQPGELLKLAFIIFFAAWLSASKRELHLFRKGLLPLLVLLGITGAVFYLQRDTDGILLLFAAAFAMYFSAGGSMKHLFFLALLAFFAGTALLYSRPYLIDRMHTFFDLQNADYLGSGYQTHQSLIAIGSGGLSGRGFGQSIQKFEFLPEPIGDSIFAVAAEEFGFLGASLIVLVFLFFALRGLSIAQRAPDVFSSALATGIVVLIITQSFVNIASMLALFPVSGTPLVFMSKGGSSLALALLEVGILLSISRHRKSA